MAKWQTRYVQVVVGATPWRFKSSHPHHEFLLRRNFVPDFGFFLSLLLIRLHEVHSKILVWRNVVRKIFIFTEFFFGFCPEG